MQACCRSSRKAPARAGVLAAASSSRSCPSRCPSRCRTCSEQGFEVTLYTPGNAGQSENSTWCSISSARRRCYARPYLPRLARAHRPFRQGDEPLLARHPHPMISFGYPYYALRRAARARLYQRLLAPPRPCSAPWCDGRQPSPAPPVDPSERREMRMLTRAPHPASLPVEGRRRRRRPCSSSPSPVGGGIG